MTYGSLFSGAGGFDLGFDAVAECAFQVEIDAPARDVLARHWPNVPRFKDVREVGKHNLPSVDVLIGGFPCQDLSVAGARKGLQGGTRSGLFYELARIACELRPEFLVWENVPGLLSSDDGRDFARVLRHLGDNGFCGGWRVLDAEGFGVAQHRRRVFGVFTRSRARRNCVAEILALRESLSWHPSEGRASRSDVAGTLGGGAAGRGWSDDLERAGAFIPLRARGLTGHDGGVNEQDDGCLVAFGQCQGTNVGPIGTIKGDNLTRGVPFVAQRVAGTLNGNGKTAGSVTQQGFGGNDCSGNARRVAAGLNAKGGAGRQDFESETFIVGTFNASDYANGCFEEKDTARPLTGTPDRSRGAPVCVTGQRTHALTHEGADASEDGTGRGTPIVAFTELGESHATYQQADVAMPICTDGGGGSQTRTIAANGLSVRRLTPRECERLQGWPDDHTRYRADGREIADGPRYRLIGNGVVKSVAAWIARRLCVELAKEPATV